MVVDSLEFSKGEQRDLAAVKLVKLIHRLSQHEHRCSLLSIPGDDRRETRVDRSDPGSFPRRQALVSASCPFLPLDGNGRSVLIRLAWRAGP